MKNIENENIKDVFYNVDDTIQKVHKMIQFMEENSLNTVSIPNIGVTYNNKLVEIIQIYKRKGLNPSSSSLMSVIQRFLVGLLSDAIKCLEGYIEVIHRRSSEPDSQQNYKTIIEETEAFLDTYKKIDNRLFDFKIEKNILEAFQKDVEFFKGVGEEGGYDFYQMNSGIVDVYNQELHDLGYEQSIPNLQENNTKDTVVGEFNLEYGVADIKKLVYKRIEEVKLQYKNTPTIAAALESQLIDYLDEASKYYQNNDMKNYVLSFQKIRQFNSQEEMIDSVGKYVAYWNSASSFHDRNELDVVSNELTSLELGTAIAEIEKNIRSDKYQSYIEYRNRLLDEQVASTMQAVSGSSETFLGDENQRSKL